MGITALCGHQTDRHRHTPLCTGSSIHIFNLIFIDQFISFHVLAALGLIQVNIHILSRTVLWPQSQMDSKTLGAIFLGVECESGYLRGFMRNK